MGRKRIPMDKIKQFISTGEYKNMTNAEIMARLNIGVTTWNKIKNEFKIKNRIKKHDITENRIKIMNDFKEELTVPQIKKLLNFKTYCAAYIFCVRNGIKFKKVGSK